MGSPGRGWDDEELESQVRKALTWTNFMNKTPLSAEVRRDIVRIQEARVDYMPGLSSAEKKARLSKMSYRDFLLNVGEGGPRSDSVLSAAHGGGMGSRN